MNFIVTYRAGNGALREERIEAASRAECGAECKRRGIAPIRIAEGGGRAVSTKPPRGDGRTKPGMWRAAVLAAVLAAVAGGAWWWFGHAGRVTLPVEKPKAEKPKIEKPKAEKPTAKVEPPVETNMPPPNIRHVKHPITGADMVVTQKVVKLLPNASRIGTVYTNNVFRPPKKLYKTFSENYVVGLMRMQSGMPVVGGRLPKNFDEEFKAHLNDPIEILPDDAEEDVRIKERMIEVKKEMARLIKEGATPSELVLNERKELNRLAQMRKNYMKDLAEYRRGGATRQQVEDYVTAANKVLDEYGVKHIRLPLEPISKIQVDQQEEKK